MRINVLSYEPQGGWILADYAEKLATHLALHVEQAVFSMAQRPGFDVTFHINYWGLRQLLVPGLHVTLITHIDSPEKLALVKAQADAGVWGLCMSEDTCRRMRTLLGSHRFDSISPVAMTGAEPKHLSIMIAGRLYEDGRKNELWAIEFFRRIHPDNLLIKVMGSGWDAQLAQLASEGYLIEYHREFDKSIYLKLLKSSDYLLVTGFDEGALSTLDAIMFGVTPIVTAQGYHLEQAGEMKLFSTFDELMQIATSLQTDVTKINQARHTLSDWSAFAVRHRDRWQSILDTGT